MDLQKTLFKLRVCFRSVRDKQSDSIMAEESLEKQQLSKTVVDVYYMS